MSVGSLAFDWISLPPEAAPELWAKLVWESDLWIFAYGSLLWEPGFPYSQAEPALLKGHHRSFCVYSRDYRGTSARPGLVLGLDRGGACKGVAYRVPAADVPAAIAYLWRREMRSRVYRLAEVEVELAARRVPALAFLVDPAHPDYAGGLACAEQARLIREGAGASGSAEDYFDRTLAELERLGAIDPALRRLERALKPPRQRRAA